MCFVSLQSLPSSMGFLKKLRTLNADENFLESIPPEVSILCPLC